MRVNVYAEEMTEQLEIISKEIDGHNFTGLRLYLHLPVTLPSGENFKGPFTHRPGDDDSAAVTFWGKRDLRLVLRKALQLLDKHYGDVHLPFVGERGPLSENVILRDVDDLAVIYGIKVAGALLREFTEPSPPGRWFRIVQVVDGVVTVQTRQLDEPE